MLTTVEPHTLGPAVLSLQNSLSPAVEIASIGDNKSRQINSHVAITIRLSNLLVHDYHYTRGGHSVSRFLKVGLDP